MYLNLYFSHVQDSIICIVFPLARHNRLLFAHNSITTKNPFKLLHFDLWGPYANATYNDCNMFLTIVDDFTISCWLYLLKCKDQYVNIVKNLLTYIENQLNSHVKFVRTDNVKGLCDEAMLQMFLTKGINNQRRCVQTS